MSDQILRSPFFYVGDKYKLISEIRQFFPQEIDTFVEPFVGGGSVFMNVQANAYYLNDIDPYVIKLHKHLSKCSDNSDKLFALVDKMVCKYGLSRSYKEDVIPYELKQTHKKTYFARFNKAAYVKMRDDFNKSSQKDMTLLYLLLIYGFNRMLRFNKNGDFNLPVGNVDFNANVVTTLNEYFEQVKTKQPAWYNKDYKSFIKGLKLSERDFIYLDPPYLITFSEYNKLWNEKNEKELLVLLDKLNERGFRFAISNVTHYKGRENTIFTSWCSRYKIHPITSNYISYHDNTIKEFNEVLVTNY